MKHFTKGSAALFLAAALTLPALSSCAGNSSDSGEASTAATTAASVDHTALLKENVYASAGETLMEETIQKYYVERTHTVKTDLTNSSPAYVWPTTAFVEALAESYALYPENEIIKNCYLDMLDHGFDQFKVSGVTLTTPSGRHPNITYYNASRGNRGDYYYDDNAWICIRYLTAYEQFGNADYLARAEEILNFLWTGWDDYQGGGIYWDKTYSGNKGVCTNGPSAVSHLWAYQITGNELYLERGKQLYDWVYETLRDDKGIYFAGVDDPWQPAYDQGTMMYAASLLYEITGDEQYYESARISSRAVVNHMFEIEGARNNQTVTMKRNPIYKAWCVGWLTRGIVKFVSLKPGANAYMDTLKKVMDQTLTTKDKNGQYDPFFCSAGNDFWDKDYFDHDVMQPSGIVIVLQLIAYYDIYLLTQ